MQKKLAVSFLVQATLVLLYCTTALALAEFDPAAAPQPPDYSEESSWLALPRDGGLKDVDVFWVYPTVLYGDSAWLMAIDDPETRRAAQKTIDHQAGVFTEHANLYAPLYRQMNLAGLTLPPEAQEARLRFGKEDVRRALEYYLDHYNEGRPYILAAHSQGSKVLTDLMVDIWGELGAEERMVAAYLIGWSITQDDLDRNPQLKICRSEEQTGCFITYNSIAAGMQDQAPTILPGAVVVNPLTWTTDTTPAPATLNLGAVFFTDDNIAMKYPAFAGAQVRGSGLVVTPVDASLLQSGNSAFPEGVYHMYDYSLFYENLKANALERIRAMGTAVNR